MRVFRNLVIAHLAYARCWATTRGGTHCQPCNGTSDLEVSGPQCYRGVGVAASPWLDRCYKKKYDCCKNAKRWLDNYDECLNGTICTNYAAISTLVQRNYDCQSFCWKDLEHLVEGLCAHEGFRFKDDKFELEGECFDQYVYGYATPDNLAGFRVFENVISPAVCQDKCQREPDCVRFLWEGEGIWPEEEINGRCILKNRQQVEGALAITFKTDTLIDTRFCPEEAESKCSNPYDCLSCDHMSRCVWKSKYHIGGPQFCGRSANSCGLNMQETLVSTSTPVTQTTGTTSETNSNQPHTIHPIMNSSDETEESLLVASSLVNTKRNPTAFESSLDSRQTKDSHSDEVHSDEVDNHGDENSGISTPLKLANPENKEIDNKETELVSSATEVMGLPSDPIRRDSEGNKTTAAH